MESITTYFKRFWCVYTRKESMYERLMRYLDEAHRDGVMGPVKIKSVKILQKLRVC